MKWTWCCLVLVVVMLLQQLSGSDTVPLLDEEQADLSVEAGVSFLWQTQAAHAALESGFPWIAVDLLDAAVSPTGAVWQEQDPLRYLYVAALLSEVKGGEAMVLLRQFPQPDSSRWVLYTGLAAMQLDDMDLATLRLEQLNGMILEESDRPWYYLMQALLAERRGDATAANAAFQELRTVVRNPSQETQFELLRWREQLRAGRSDERTVTELRATERSMQGRRGGFEAARLLAIALHQLGRKQDAIEVIDRQLRLPGVNELELREQFLLLLGLVSGEESLRGRLALQQLLRESRSLPLQRNALHLLLRAAFEGEGVREFLDLLTELIERPQAHPLFDELLSVRALLRAEMGSFDAAEADALQLIEQFPGSPQVGETNRLLAYISWQRRPPRYRLAADYLNRYRQTLEAGALRDQVTVLMADSFFLNGDYPNAADLYASVRPRLTGELKTATGYQQVLAWVRSERFTEAGELLDQIRGAAEMDITWLWRAEWNLLDALRKRGKSEDAFARLQILLENSVNTASEMQFALRVRLMWLEAQLTMDSGRFDEVPALCDELLKLLDDSSEELSDEDRIRIQSHTLLLKGDSFYRMGQAEAGTEVFAQLRAEYPNSGPAVLSYLIEARDWTAQSSLVSAQQSLIRLADLFPANRFAPIALWEAALNAEQRGLNSTYQEAISILERLANDYSDHYLVYYARLKQADLSRKLNDFGTALLLYDNLLKQYPNHPERFRALLSSGDCLLARGSQHAVSFEDAAAQYERVFAMANAPIDARAEAGYKWTTALRLAGRSESAESAFWVVYQQIVVAGNVTDASTASERTKYWLSRAMFQMAGWQEEAKRFEAAAKLYSVVIERKLPGLNLAARRLHQLTELSAS